MSADFCEAFNIKVTRTGWNGKRYSYHPRSGPCVKCKSKDHIETHHVTYTPEWTVALCGKCHGNITSVNTHVSRVTKEKLSNEQRIWLWRWFMTNKYFSEHRRFSRGRARKLVQEMSGGGQVTDAKVEKGKPGQRG